jgi:hypothetical protein
MQKEHSYILREDLERNERGRDEGKILELAEDCSCWFKMKVTHYFLYIFDCFVDKLYV